MNTNQLPFGFSLPMLSDDTAVEIHDFLQIAIQIFEGRYGEQIDRHYERLCKDHIEASSPKPLPDDWPF